METLLEELVERLREEGSLSPRELAAMIERANERAGGDGKDFSKKKLLPAYWRLKREEPERWEALGVDDELEAKLVETLRMKPGRTASGVATVTVITKPWPCANDCRYCPSDLRMPKSYIHDEPACRRAERNCFDPYLQASSRLLALHEMGHLTDKVELIVLGGTWVDYPESYRRWFVSELFRALNEPEWNRDEVEERRRRYEKAGIVFDEEAIENRVASEQRRVDAGEEGYARAWKPLYGPGSPWDEVASWQEAELAEVVERQRVNETAPHRCVGLVIETRPDTISCESLRSFRELGCTKVQIGVQSLRDEVLSANGRAGGADEAKRAFGLIRLFGFKIHAHFMVNLLGMGVEEDKADYGRFVSDPAFCPDEVKLYPCALIAGTRLVDDYERGAWRPYSDGELLDVLSSAERATPPWTRISRMVRDFTADDVYAGSKTSNMRQEVERALSEEGARVDEMRYREVRGRDFDVTSLSLCDVPYETTVSDEHFLQWTTPDGGIAGFLRLSLPKREAVETLGDELPVGPGTAMIRELHVYGRVAGIDEGGANAQHKGLGRKLVERACEIAEEAGYAELYVISAVGTREYYRRLGFSDAGLYQARDL